MKHRTFIIDGTEITIGGRKSGIIIRYRGKIHGVMILVRGIELSWFKYSMQYPLSWSHIIRLPFKRRAITF
jgi:hypothetical protein